MRHWCLSTLLLLAPSISWSFTSIRSHSASTTQPRPATRGATARRAEGYDYTPITWALDFTVPDDETRRVLEVCDLDAIWPSGAGSLDREAFRQRLRARGASNDRAIDSVFNAFTGGTYLITRRDAVQETLTACRAGGQVNTGALAGGLFGARLQIIGAWLFLNVFSVFAGYFIIGRPILFQSLGIDLLPTLPRYWE